MLIHFYTGLSQLDAKASGRMGTRALVYYGTTTLTAAVLGIFCVLAIHPGDPSIKGELGSGAKKSQVSSLDAFLDLIRCGFSLKQMIIYCQLAVTALISLQQSVLIDYLLYCFLPFRNLFPENLVQACFQQVQTIFVPKKASDIVAPKHNGTNMTTIGPLTTMSLAELANATNETVEVELVRQLQFKDGMNVLGTYAVFPYISNEKEDLYVVNVLISEY